MSDEPEPWWTYRARPAPDTDHENGVVDGDTLDLLLDQGLDTHGVVRLRLSGVDTAEVYGVAHDSEEYAIGSEHSAYVREWLAEAVEAGGPWPLVVRTEQDEGGKYGRLLADVTRRVDGANLADDVAAEYPETDESEGSE